MVGASDAFRIDSAEGEGCESMRTLLGHQTILDAGTPVCLPQPEQNQIFTQDSDFLDGFVGAQLTGRRDRMPIAPQQFSGRRPGTYLGHGLVFLLRNHAQIPFAKLFIAGSC
jgi:hypothetical protein